MTPHGTNRQQCLLVREARRVAADLGTRPARHVGRARSVRERATTLEAKRRERRAKRDAEKAKQLQEAELERFKGKINPIKYTVHYEFPLFANVNVIMVLF